MQEFAGLSGDIRIFAGISGNGFPDLYASHGVQSVYKRAIIDFILVGRTLRMREHCSLTIQGCLDTWGDF